MENILDDLTGEDNIEVNYQVASKGKRFANYFIDSIGYLILSAGFGVLLALFNSDSILLQEDDLGIVSRITDWLLGLIIVTTYYTLMEYLLKGKSLGKYITNTRAITIDNKRMDLGTTIKRSLCRVIPFEAFSFLGDKPTGWHDTISDTKVIMDDGWYDSDDMV